MAERDTDRLQGRLDDLFAELLHVPGFAGLRRGLRPHVDCYATEDPPTITVVVEVPGVEDDDLQVVVSERTIDIAGVRRRPQPRNRLSYQQMELEYGRFHRRIALGEDVDPDGAEASCDRGILTVVLPVARRAPLGRITIVVRRA